MPGERPVELEQVPLRDGVADGLPQLVGGDRVDGRLGGVARVVAVDHLADEPRVGVPLADAREDRGPERRGDGVGGVEAPAGDAAVEPVDHHLGHVRAHGLGVVVERDERAMALEADGRAGAVPAEPGGGLGSRAVGERLREPRVAASHVVEDAVEEHPHAARGGVGEEGVEVGVVAESRVERQVVAGVVAVGLRVEDRAEQQAVGAEVDEVREPRAEAVDAVGGRRVGMRGGSADGSGEVVAGLRRAREAERVDVPPDDVIGPGCQGSLLAVRVDQA